MQIEDAQQTQGWLFGRGGKRQHEVSLQPAVEYESTAEAD
jgi:hypothetical protein